MDRHHASIRLVWTMIKVCGIMAKAEFDMGCGDACSASYWLKFSLVFWLSLSVWRLAYRHMLLTVVAATLEFLSLFFCS